MNIKIKDLTETLIPGCVVISTSRLSLLSNQVDCAFNEYPRLSYDDNVFCDVEKNTKFIVTNIYIAKEEGTYNRIILYSTIGQQVEPLYMLKITLYHIDKNIKLSYGIYFENYDSMVDCQIEKII